MTSKTRLQESMVRGTIETLLDRIERQENNGGVNIKDDIHALVSIHYWSLWIDTEEYYAQYETILGSDHVQDLLVERDNMYDFVRSYNILSDYILEE